MWRLRAAVAVVATWALLGAPLPAGRGTDGLRVTAFDVGQGDAVLLRTPEAAVLVDTGPSGGGIGRHLRRSGVRRLDLLVLTHGDGDHVGGLRDVLDAVAVDAVWWRPPSADAAADEAIAPLRARDAPPVAGPRAGDVARLGDLRLVVLAPAAGRPWAWTDREDNETSIVVRAEWHGRRVLLAGDVERHAQAELLADDADLRVDVLVVPHHGSRTSDPAFLTAVSASHAVVSAGRGNPFGHPHPDVVGVLEASGALVHRTDRDGTVDLVLHPP